ncbi:MAG TPA: cation diffusion facilitator family transporter [Acidimicrobiales bacterium]|nr:cation diffusion facilitator family transporter [Acidimicrobiales bacterium]
MGEGHGPGSGHGLGHGPGHGHGPASVDTDRRALSLALALLVAFMAFEVGAAVYANSLALLADAGHMLVDVGAIALSLVAIRLAARPESGSHTYGMKRAEILAAAANGLALLVVSVLVTYDAIVRLLRPGPVHGGVLIVVAAVGVAVNLVATMAVARANRRSLNVEGAYRHILTDLYGFAGTLVAGIVIVVSGFDRADAIASLLVVALMLKAAWALLRPAVHILLEATPEDIDLGEVRRHLMELPEVQSVHDLHAWTLTSSLPILTAHVVVTDDCFTTGEAGRVLDHLQECLSGHFDVSHSTLQFESAGHIEHELGGHT